MRTQQEGGHLKASKSPLTRHDLPAAPRSGLLASRAVRKSIPVVGATQSVAWQPEENSTTARYSPGTDEREAKLNAHRKVMASGTRRQVSCSYGPNRVSPSHNHTQKCQTPMGLYWDIGLHEVISHKS